MTNCIKHTDHTLPQLSTAQHLSDTEVYDSELNRALYSTTTDKLLTKTELARSVGKIGATVRDKPCEPDHIPEIDPHKQANQLAPVLRAQYGSEYIHMSFRDMMNKLNALGVDIRKFAQWGRLEAFNYLPPITIDKFANYADYVWAHPDPNTAPEYVTIANAFRAADYRLWYHNSTHADIVAAVPPTSPTVGMNWFDTTTRTNKRWDGTSWRVSVVAHDVTGVNVTANTLSIGNVDLTDKIKPDSLMAIGDDAVCIVTAAEITFDDQAYATIVKLKEPIANVSMMIGKPVVINVVDYLLAVGPTRYITPTSSEFRSLGRGTFSIQDLADLVWHRYASILRGTHSTTLGVSIITDTTGGVSSLHVEGVRPNDFALLPTLPNNGLYTINSLTSEKSMSVMVPASVGTPLTATGPYEIIRSQQLLNIDHRTPPTGPYVGQYWHDTEGDVVRQYSHVEELAGDCIPLDDEWPVVVTGVSKLIAALGPALHATPPDYESDWSDVNYWVPKYIADLMGIRGVLAQQPIIEFSAGLEMSEWHKTEHKWEYRSNSTDPWQGTEIAPKLFEINPFEIYYPESATSIMLGSMYGNRTADFAPGSEFRISGTVGAQLDGVYKVARVSFVRWALDEFRTRIDLDPTTPLPATFSNPDGQITPVVTSAGDEWRGYDTHWQYIGAGDTTMVGPQRKHVMHTIENNVLSITSDPTHPHADEVIVALTWQKNSIRTPKTIDSITLDDELHNHARIGPYSAARVYHNGRRLIGTTDIESTIAPEFVGGVRFATPIDVQVGDVIRIEIGPDVSSDLGKQSVAVPTPDGIQYVSLVEYSHVPQQRVERNQAPLFAVYDINQTPQPTSSTIFEYAEDPDGTFNKWLQKYVKVDSNGDWMFEYTLHSSDKLLSFNDRAHQFADQTVTGARTVWFSHPSHPQYETPQYVNKCGEPTCIVDENGRLNENGYWKVPKFWTNNLAAETRTINSAAELAAHFTSILVSNESTLPTFARAINHSVGGTIKMFNYAPNLLGSSMLLDTITPIDLLEWAADKYAEQLADIERYAKEAWLGSLHNAPASSVEKYIEWAVDTALNTFSNNETRDKCFGDSYNSRYIKGFIDTLPVFGYVDYTQPIIEFDEGTGSNVLRHHDGHLSVVSHNVTQLRHMLLPAAKKIKKIRAFDAAHGNNITTIPVAAVGDIVAILTGNLVDVYQVIETDAGVRQYEYYMPDNAVVLNTTRDTLGQFIGYNVDTATWSKVDLVACLGHVIEQVRYAVELRLYAGSTELDTPYNLDLVVPDSNYSKLMQDRFERYLDRTNNSAGYASYYSATDPWTWNYTSAVPKKYPQLTNPANIGSWQALYEFYYGTPYPHLEPWKLQKYTSKPNWWDVEYRSPDNSRKWTSRMWFNIVHGIIPIGRTSSNGIAVSNDNQYQLVAGYNYVPVNTEDQTLVVNDPVLAATHTYGPDELLPPYINTTVDPTWPSWSRSLFNVDPATGAIDSGIPNAALPYAFGNGGREEWKWKSSLTYNYDRLTAAWQIDPIRFMALAYGTSTTSIGRLLVGTELENVYSHRTDTFHGDYVDDSTTVRQVRGLNQWYVNYHRDSNVDVSGSMFKQLWTTWESRLAYEFDKVIVPDTLELTSDTFDPASGDYTVEFKRTQMLDRLEHAGLRVKVIDAPSKYSPLRADGKGWKFEVSSLSPYSNAMTVREQEIYQVLPGYGDDLGKWYIDRFAIVGVRQYNINPYQEIDYAGGWVSKNDLTNATVQPAMTLSFVLNYRIGITPGTIVVTIGSDAPEVKTIGTLIDAVNAQLVNGQQQIAKLVISNGNLRIVAETLRGTTLSLDPSLDNLFHLLTPTDPVTGQVRGSYRGILPAVEGDPFNRTAITVEGNQSLSLADNARIRLVDTGQDSIVTVGDVEYDILTDTTTLIVDDQLSAGLLPEGYVTKIHTDIQSQWEVGEEVFLSSTETLPSPFMESVAQYVAHVHMYQGTDQVEYIVLAPSVDKAKLIATSLEDQGLEGAVKMRLASAPMSEVPGEITISKLQSTFQALQGAVTAKYWKRHKLLDSYKTHIGPVQIISVQRLIDFVHAYEAAGNDQGFVFSTGIDSITDEVTGRINDWQLQLEKFLSSIYGREYVMLAADNKYEVYFADNTTLRFKSGHIPDNWTNNTLIRFERGSGATVPEIIDHINPSLRNSTTTNTFYTSRDNKYHDGIKLSFNYNNMRSEDFIAFDLPTYQPGIDPDPFLEYVDVPTDTVRVEHNKNEANLQELDIDTSAIVPAGATWTAASMSADAIEIKFDVPVTGTIAVRYKPTSYPTHTETLTQPALAAGNSAYEIKVFDIVHNLDTMDPNQLTTQYNTVSFVDPSQRVAPSRVEVLNANTLRVTFPVAVTGDAVITKSPQVRQLPGKLYVRTISRVAPFEAEINPYQAGCWIKTPVGTIRQIFDVGRSRYVDTMIYDLFGKPLKNRDVLVLRQDQMTKMLLDPHSALRTKIGGMRLVTSGAEHICIFNYDSYDGTKIYDPFTGSHVQLLYAEFEGQRKQNHRRNIGGYYWDSGTLTRNLEGTIEDLRYAYDTFNSSESNLTVLEARKTIGYDATQQYLKDNNINRKSQFLFWKAMIKHKGTSVPLEAFLRGVDVDDIIVDEYYARKIAEYGDNKERTWPQMKLQVKDGVHSELKIEFQLPAGVSLDKSFIPVKLTDQDRWVNHPDVVANSPYPAFFLNGQVVYIDTEPHWIYAPDGVYYYAPIDSDGAIIFETDVATGEQRTYHVRGDFEQKNSRLLKMYDDITNTELYENSVVALISWGKDSQNPAALIDREARVKVEDIIMWHPARNMWDPHAYQVVDIQQPTDPASYDQDEWLQDAVGTVWFDDSWVQHKPYWDSTVYPAIEDRLAEWGNLQDWSSIKLYTWVETDVPPEQWDAQLASDPMYPKHGTPRVNTTVRVEHHVPYLLALKYFETRPRSIPGQAIARGGVGTPISILVEDKDADLFKVTAQLNAQGIEVGHRPTAEVHTGSVGTVEVGISDISWNELEEKWEIQTTFTFAANIDGLNVTVDLQSDVDVTAYDMPAFEADSQLDVYVNGSYHATVEEPLLLETLLNDQMMSEYRYAHVTVINKSDATALPYNTRKVVDPITKQEKNLYYYWVEGWSGADSTKNMNAVQAAKILTKTDNPYMIWEDLRTEEEGYGIIWGTVYDQYENGLPARYRKLIVRGLSGAINQEDRYSLRFARDFTLRDKWDDAKSNVHSEWQLIRKGQSHKIDFTLWESVIESLIGHTLRDPTVAVPALNRVLYDTINGTDTRFGMGTGQSFVDQRQGLNTIKHVLTRQQGPFAEYDGALLLSRYDLTRSTNIQQMMVELYYGTTAEQLNYLFFELLEDSLGNKAEYREIFKTSWVSLQVNRTMKDVHVPLAEEPVLGACWPVPTTTTTTQTPTAIDYVDVIGCSPFTTTTLSPLPPGSCYLLDEYGVPIISENGQYIIIEDCDDEPTTTDTPGSTTTTDTPCLPLVITPPTLSPAVIGENGPITIIAPSNITQVIVAGEFDAGYQGYVRVEDIVNNTAEIYVDLYTGGE